MARTTALVGLLSLFASSAAAQKANTFEIVGLTGASGESNLLEVAPGVGASARVKGTTTLTRSLPVVLLLRSLCSPAAVSGPGTLRGVVGRASGGELGAR